SKDDPRDADLLLDLLLQHRDKLRRLSPDTEATRRVQNLVEERRKLVDEKTAQSKPPSQTWRTFLSNHLTQTAYMDVFTVPTATFRVLFVFVVLSHARRRIVHFAVTEHPTQEWTIQQLREALPWNQAPRYLLRQRDAIYGQHLVAVIQGMGIEE